MLCVYYVYLPFSSIQPLLKRFIAVLETVVGGAVTRLISSLFANHHHHYMNNSAEEEAEEWAFVDDFSDLNENELDRLFAEPSTAAGSEVVATRPVGGGDDHPAAASSSSSTSVPRLPTVRPAGMFAMASVYASTSTENEGTATEPLVEAGGVRPATSYSSSSAPFSSSFPLPPVLASSSTLPVQSQPVASSSTRPPLSDRTIIPIQQQQPPPPPQTMTMTASQRRLHSIQQALSSTTRHSQRPYERPTTTSSQSQRPPGSQQQRLSAARIFALIQEQENTIPPSPSSPKRKGKKRALSTTPSSAQSQSPNAKRLKTISSLTECPICIQTIAGGMSTNPCGHSFCGSCIVSWLRSSSGGRKCPMCRSILEDTMPVVPNVMLDNVIAAVSSGGEEEKERVLCVLFFSFSYCC